MNKLFAEFLGYKLTPCNNGLAWSKPEDVRHDLLGIHGVLYKPNDTTLKFNTSWEWLMLVIYRIEAMPFGFLVKIENDRCIVNQNTQHYLAYKDDFELPEIHERSEKFQATLKAVGEFVSWYNKNKKKLALIK